jgi:UDP-N-acetylmuramoyl-L-alanyl-D-glutamate--2,6-diaminopimelate ligase
VLLGTIETHVGDVVRESEHTTPESRDVLAVFAEGVRAGCTEVVMEMSSHALEQERVWGIPVDVAMFTNLTQDHLDYHGTMEKYARAKARLFEGVGAGAPRVAVINEEDDYAGMMIDHYAGEEFVVRYGVSENANHRAEAIEISPGRTRFRFVTPVGEVAIESPLTGMVNVENLLAAMCGAMARGLTLEEVQRAAATLKAVPGRFELVPGSREAGFTVVVDYAHTDDALKNLISLGRDLVKERDGRVIVMFGCGGDRDRGKRPKMGRVAGEGGDLVVVTSDNPRSEDPMAIVEEILVGVRETKAECLVEVDRRAAIAVAIRAAKTGDIVLLAGKGHEKTQTFASGAVHFDDVEEADKVLREIRR